MAYDCSVEEERLQKKLLPFNIVVCIICLVAAISLIVAPFITFDMRKFDNDTLSESVGIDVEATFKDMGFDLELDVVIEKVGGEISISALDIAKFAFSEENSIKLLLDAAVAYASPIIDDIIIDLFIPKVIEGIAQEAGIDTSNVDVNAINDDIKALGDANTEAEFRVAASDLIDELAKFGDTEIPADTKTEFLDTFAEFYNKTVDATGGDFDLEKLLCVVLSDVVGLEEPATSYTDFLYTSMEQASGGESQGEGEGEVAGSTDAANTLLDEIDFQIKLAAKIFFGVMASVAALWLILFLFALFHAFAQNKRFTMWYVKLLGGFPWLIFGLIPLVLQWVFPIAAPLLGAITSLTWISGVCYLLLWILSIFWAYPIKRKIKKERNS